MTTTPTQQPASDHGEPWQLTTDFAFDITIRGELAASFDKIEHANRAIACVNACAGMADPSEEIAKLRIEIQMLRGMIKAMQQKRDEASAKLNAAEECLQKMIRSVPAQLNGFYFWPVISPDGDYLGEEPADPASVMYGMAEEAQKVLSELQSSR